ncbi:MAG TPA: adenosylcobinamide amidohydrolase [Methanocorpusculum sp.]|nr:adenosylcobinamide amidohydrolase [Methanocorpusculum sp.]
MRYHYTADTLYVRGMFHAASTGIAGGISDVSTIFNRTVPMDFSHDSPIDYVNGILEKKQYGRDAFGMLTAVSMQDLCILQFDYITVFVTAGVSNPNPDPVKPHTINIIVVSAEGMTDAALLNTIITATEAKAQALKLLGRDFTGTTSDAVVVASEGPAGHTYAGTFTEPGKRVYSAVLKGVMEAVKRHEGTVKHHGPSYFIYSRYNQTGWFEWVRKECPYYPCHFEGQACDFCYCPFYPCMDESLGEWVESSSGNGRVWACSDCHLLHDCTTADYLIAHPDADFSEIRNLQQ